MAGTWNVAVAPILHVPHRWAANEEFAFDPPERVGGDGEMTSIYTSRGGAPKRA
jgi:hypothetical protein